MFYCILVTKSCILKKQRNVLENNEYGRTCFYIRIYLVHVHLVRNNFIELQNP